MGIIELRDYRYLKLLLRIFNIFGLATFSLEKIGVRRKIHSDRGYPTFVVSRIFIVYNFLLISIISSINCFAIDLLYTRYKKPLSVINIVDIFQIFFGTSVSVFVLIFYCINRKTSMSVAAQIYKVKMIINQLNVDYKRKSVFCLLLFLTFHIIMSIFVVLTASMTNSYNLILSFGSALRNFVVTWLFLQYALVVKILLVMFERMNETLTSSLLPVPLFDVQSYHFGNRINSSYDSASTKKLQLLSTVRDVHYSLFQICHEVANFYSIPVLGCVAYMFLCLVVFAYFLIGIVIERNITFPVIDYVHFFLWFVYFISSFLMLAIYITRITDEIDKTGTIIHQLMRNTMSNQILKELQDFSLYLLHIRVKFTAWHFFTLGGNLLQSIFSSITTYLVILVQFKLNSTAKLQTQENN